MMAPRSGHAWRSGRPCGGHVCGITTQLRHMAATRAATPRGVLTATPSSDVCAPSGGVEDLDCTLCFLGLCCSLWSCGPPPRACTTPGHRSVRAIRRRCSRSSDRRVANHADLSQGPMHEYEVQSQLSWGCADRDSLWRFRSTSKTFTESRCPTRTTSLGSRT